MKVFITGTPGTGKSTLSLALKSSLNVPNVFEIKDLLSSFDLLEEYEPERDTTLFDEEKATTKIQSFLVSKENYLLVGPPLDFNQLSFDAVIVLICSKKLQLQERLSSRGYSQSKIDENIEAELLGEILGQSMDMFQERIPILTIDTCKLTIEESVDKIKKFLGI